MQRTDFLKAQRLCRELTAELQRLEHRESDTIPGFDATDDLEDIRAMRDHAEEIAGMLEIKAFVPTNL